MTENGWLPGNDVQNRVTLRDQMAMAALSGACVTDNDISQERMASWCYRMADAMLAARSAKDGK